jgi:undecaprenyl phosphate-alpha-L-ara4N flippase subunit ArnF
MNMSIVSRRRAYCLIALAIVLSSLAQLLFRIGMQHSNALARFSAATTDSLADGLASADALIVAAGLVCYAVSMLAWLIALSRVAVSFAYPLLSVTYVLVYAAAVSWPPLGEQGSVQQLAGIAAIVAGVVVLCGTDEDRHSA